MAYRGKSLKALRESRQIKLRRISNQTRISMSYLVDLEEERFDRFPGKFYFKSFSREYAKSLGLDPHEVVDDLLAAYDEWSGNGEANQAPMFSEHEEQGLLNRVADYIRRAQEV